MRRSEPGLADARGAARLSLPAALQSGVRQYFRRRHGARPGHSTVDQARSSLIVASTQAPRRSRILVPAWRFAASGSWHLSTDGPERCWPADELTKFAANRLASYRMPEEITFLDDPPRISPARSSAVRCGYLAGSHKQVGECRPAFTSPGESPMAKAGLVQWSINPACIG
jgi:hypothetical protein